MDARSAQRVLAVLCGATLAISAATAAATSASPDIHRAYASGAPAGRITIFPLNDPGGDGPRAVALGSDGNVWFGEYPNNIGVITPDGHADFFRIPTPPGDHQEPVARFLTPGSDGAMWFTAETARRSMIASVSPSGSFTEVMMGRHQKAWDLVTAPDGNLWFTAGKFGIGRLTHGSDVRIFGLPKDPSTTDLTVGPDGRLWFAEPQNGVVGRFDPRTHRYRTFALPGSTPLPVAVGSGPDGNLWIADPGDRAIVRMTPSGHTRAFPLGAHLGPASVVPGPDGNVWFVAQNSHEVVRIQPDGTIKGYVVPSEPSCQQYPTAITAGSDGAMWFSLPCVPAMGRLQIRTEIPAVRR